MFTYVDLKWVIWIWKPDNLSAHLFNSWTIQHTLFNINFLHSIPAGANVYGAFLLSKLMVLKSNINNLNRPTLCRNEWTNSCFNNLNRSIFIGVEQHLVKSNNYLWNWAALCNFHPFRFIHIRIEKHFLESINTLSNRSIHSRIERSINHHLH